MEYWVAFKQGKYISGTDEFGYPVHTEKKEDAWRFPNLQAASQYFELGYCIIKERF